GSLASSTSAIAWALSSTHAASSPGVLGFASSAMGSKERGSVIAIRYQFNHPCRRSRDSSAKSHLRCSRTHRPCAARRDLSHSNEEICYATARTLGPFLATSDCSRIGCPFCRRHGLGS